MIAFIVECENRPGEIARVSEPLAEKGINITLVGSVSWGKRGAIGLLTADEDGTRNAFEKSGLTYREVETVEFSLPDRPGMLAEASRKLANAGVNVEFLAASGMTGGEVTLVAAVDNEPMARQALATLVSAHA